MNKNCVTVSKSALQIYKNAEEFVKRGVQDDIFGVRITVLKKLINLLRRLPCPALPYLDLVRLTKFSRPSVKNLSSSNSNGAQAVNVRYQFLDDLKLNKMNRQVKCIAEEDKPDKEQDMVHFYNVAAVLKMHYLLASS